MKLMTQNKKVYRALLRLVILVLGLIIAFAVFPGCGGKDDVDVRPVVRKKPNKPAPKPTIKDVTDKLEEKLKEESFSTLNWTDPFRPMASFLARAEKQIRPSDEKRLTPLQKFDLGQLKLVAVIMGEGPGSSRAMVEDSVGTGFIVKVGTMVGTREGKITSILTDRIKVIEYTKNYLGDRVAEESYLKLPRDKDADKRELEAIQIEGENK